MRNRLLVDMDGTITTLKDYVDIFQSIMRNVAMEMGVDIRDWNQWKIYSTFVAAGHVNNIKNMKMVGLNPERFWNKVIKEDCRKRENLLGSRIKLYDDVSVLRKMSENGFDMGILTDQSEIVTKMYMERFNLDFFREAVCGNYITELSKPDTLGAKLLMKKLGADTGNAVMIGDADIDITTARRVGIPVIQITREEELDYGPQQPDAVIKTFHELPEAIKKISKR